MRLWIYILLLGIVLASCEKVIDIDLNDSDPQIVVEAELFAGINDVKVKLSYTSSFFKEEEQDPVDGATVTLMKQGAEPIILNYAGEGRYVLENYDAEQEKSYVLSIDVAGINYSSTATMPPSVQLDSLSQQFNEGMFGEEGGSVVFMHWKDDGDVANYYRALYSLNGEEQRSSSDVFIFDDNFTNGNETFIPLFVSSFQQGDTVDVKFVSIDSKSYDYLLTLNTIIGNGQPSAAPANPNSNFSNGALGYFAIYNGAEERIIIE